MKLRRLSVLLVAALAVAGCTHQPLKAPCKGGISVLLACVPQPIN